MDSQHPRVAAILSNLRVSIDMMSYTVQQTALVDQIPTCDSVDIRECRSPCDGQTKIREVREETHDDGIRWYE